MMMPAPPRADFVVAHPQLLLARLEAGLNWPAHDAGANQPVLRQVRRRVAQIGFQFSVREAAAQHQPDLRPWQSFAHSADAQPRKIAARWAGYMRSNLLQPVASMRLITVESSDHVAPPKLERNSDQGVVAGGLCDLC